MDTMVGSHKSNRYSMVGGGVPTSLSGGGLTQVGADGSKSAHVVSGGSLFRFHTLNRSLFSLVCAGMMLLVNLVHYHIHITFFLIDAFC